MVFSAADGTAATASEGGRVESGLPLNRGHLLFAGVGRLLQSGGLLPALRRFGAAVAHPEDDRRERQAVHQQQQAHRHGEQEAEAGARAEKAGAAARVARSDGRRAAVGRQLLHLVQTDRECDYQGGDAPCVKRTANEEPSGDRTIRNEEKAAKNVDAHDVEPEECGQQQVVQHGGHRAAHGLHLVASDARQEGEVRQQQRPRQRVHRPTGVEPNEAAAAARALRHEQGQANTGDCGAGVRQVPLDWRQTQQR